MIAARHFTIPLIDTAELVFMSFDNITKDHVHAHTHTHTHTYTHIQKNFHG